MITGSTISVLRKVGLSLTLTMAVLTTTALAQRPSQPDARPTGEPWFVSPAINTADIDSTTAPCEDFYQYATGGWYRRMPPSPPWDHYNGDRPGRALQQILERARVATTTDLITQVLGTFYGSCLRDATGAAEGAAGDSVRIRYCLRETRRYLAPALLTVLLTQVWPPAARAESRLFWEHMNAAAVARIRTSAALTDSIKQPLSQRAAATTLAMIGSNPSGPQDIHIPFLPFLDTVARPKVYANYAGLVLSPTDFAQNRARLQARTDTLPPFLQLTVPALLGAIFRETRNVASYSYEENRVRMPPGSLMPPMVDGTIDIGGWYGMTSVFGHEMAHGYDNAIFLKPLRQAFTDEQLRGQYHYWGQSQLFQDQIGILLTHDAFERAMRGRPRRPIEGLTPEQRFFIGTAQGWRGGMEGSQARMVRMWRMGVNGALSALPAFARAFGCQAGGPMTGARVWALDPRPPLTVPSRVGEPTARDWQYLTDWGQAEWFEQQFILVTASHQKYRQALTDSLGIIAPGTITAARRQRIANVVVQQIGELRAQRPAAEQATLDAHVRTWVRQYTEPSWRVSIPWLAP